MHNFIPLLNQISQTWFEIFFQNSVQLVIIFTLIYVLTTVFRKKSATFLYAIWLAFLLKAILIPGFQVSIFHTFKILKYPMINDNIYKLSVISTTPTESTFFSQISLNMVLFVIWVIGILTLLSAYIRNEKLFYTSLYKAEPLKIDGLIQDLQNKLNIKRHVNILTAPNVPAPFTKGLKNPIIYLPEDARTWNHNQLKHVISHELAHVKRKDIILITFQNIINTIYFFHPLVWIANHQINFQREKICDDIAISLLDEKPFIYGRTLMDNLESFLVRKKMPFIANGFFFSKKTIIKRFEYLFNQRKEIKMKLNALQKILVVILVMIVVVLSCNNESDDSLVKSEQQLSQETQAKFVPYDKPPEPIGGLAAIQKNIVYPREEKEAKHEGTVVIQAYIDENGKVTKAIVLRTSGLEALDKAGKDAILKTEFSPAKQKGKPVGVYISIPVIFKIKK